MNLFDSIDQALAGALMFFAVQAGSVPAKQPQVASVPAHRVVSTVRSKHVSVPLPRKRIDTALPASPTMVVVVKPLPEPKLLPLISDTMPPRLPALANLPKKVAPPPSPTQISPMPPPTFTQKPHSFQWDSTKIGALPSTWMQIWAFVG